MYRHATWNAFSRSAHWGTGGGRESFDSARHRRARGHDGIWEDGSRIQADSRAKHQHVGLGTPAATAGTMGGAALRISRHRLRPHRCYPRRKEPTGVVDVATIQSLVRKGEVSDLV